MTFAATHVHDDEMCRGIFSQNTSQFYVGSYFDLTTSLYKRYIIHFDYKIQYFANANVALILRLYIFRIFCITNDTAPKNSHDWCYPEQHG